LLSRPVGVIYLYVCFLLTRVIITEYNQTSGGLRESTLRDHRGNVEGSPKRINEDK